MARRPDKFSIGMNFPGYLFRVEDGCTYFAIKCDMRDLVKLRDKLNSTIGIVEKAKLKLEPKPRKPRAPTFSLGQTVKFLGLRVNPKPEGFLFTAGDLVYIVHIDKAIDGTKVYSCIRESDRDKWNTDHDRVDGEELVASEIEKISKRKPKVDTKDKDFALTAPYFVCWREQIPNSPRVKEGNFFREQGGLRDDWGKYWEPIDATSIGDARRKIAARHGVTLSSIYLNEP